LKKPVLTTNTLAQLQLFVDISAKRILKFKFPHAANIESMPLFFPISMNLYYSYLKVFQGPDSVP